jgi:glutamate synthase (ferredoxin)
MVGRVDRLRASENSDHWKAGSLDLSPILYKQKPPPELVPTCSSPFQDHGIDKALDHQLIRQALPALERQDQVRIHTKVRNIYRTVGTLISYEISKRYGAEGLPDDTIIIHAHGSCGQSFGAFGARGLTLHVQGDANDYLGKGFSGARLSIRPPQSTTFAPEDNMIIGNVALYGATAGEAYVNGIAGERFCVRNSGASAVVEGVGDHGCEYMTGGRVVILGQTGRNFAAGMSGGIAYVLDETGDFKKHRCNKEMVDLEPVTDERDVEELHRLIRDHVAYTQSRVGQRVLDEWNDFLPRFVKVIPMEYKKALKRLGQKEPITNA